MYRDLGNRAFELLQIIGREFDGNRADILIQTLELPASRYREVISVMAHSHTAEPGSRNFQVAISKIVLPHFPNSCILKRREIVIHASIILTQSRFEKKHPPAFDGGCSAWEREHYELPAGIVSYNATR